MMKVSINIVSRAVPPLDIDAPCTPKQQTDGIHWLFCEEINRKADGGVYYWSYIYYLSKYVEFIDTLFKVREALPNESREGD